MRHLQVISFKNKSVIRYVKFRPENKKKTAKCITAEFCACSHLCSGVN